MRNYSFFGKRNNLTLSHSYKSHGCGLVPWLPGHSQLSMKPTLQALESWLHGVPVGCSVLYNMHHEGSSRGGDFMAFKLAKVLGNSHATHGSGLALINCIVADHSQLCYTICTMKAPPQALEGPGEGRSLYGI